MSFSRRSFIRGSAVPGRATLTTYSAESIAATDSKQGSAPHTDPMFDVPYVDVDEWRDTPFRHRHVRGGFVGTDARFQSRAPVL